MENKSNLVYESEWQLLVNNYRARRTYIEAARATGKSSIASDYFAGLVTSLPRSTSLLCGCNKRQLLGITVPALKQGLSDKWHWIEGVHYTATKAPVKAGFELPVYAPQSWSNILHFRNGSVIASISTATSSCANGYSVQGLLVEEAKFVDVNTYRSSVVPAIRSAVQSHPNWRKGIPGDRLHPGNPYFFSEWSVSDKPVTAKQAGWSNYMRERANQPEALAIRDQLAEMVDDLQYAMEMGVADKLLATPEFLPRLNDLRCQATLAFSFSTFENLGILAAGGDPEDFIKNLRHQLSDSLFRITVCNQDVSQKTVDTYYKSFDEDIHTYDVDDDSTEQLLRSGYTHKVKGKNAVSGSKYDYEDLDSLAIAEINDTCAIDADLDQDAPLIFGFDYNHGINTLVVGQWRENFQRWGKCLTILNTMYNMDETRLEGLCSRVCRRYVYKKVKEAIVCIDATAKQGGSYASQFGDDFRFYNIIKRELEKHGWTVVIYDIGQPMQHSVKYEFVNSCFTGDKGFLPLINRTQNDVLLASIANSKMYYGVDGKPRKDKRGEKRTLADASEDEKLLIAATDVSDAFDVVLIACAKSQGNFAAQRGKWGLPGMRAHRLRTS